ncbi:hypothetical protein [Pseudoalteromonas distincta]|uniref:hypothetical protein n=1 Tax=Pseudoalteromonas distincta TaxID=77608 RepID=UPI0032E302AE
MLSIISKIKNKIIANIVGYYNSQRYEFKQQQWQQTNEHKNVKILVVSPRFYSQTVKKYPITDRSELKKLLKLQRSSNHFYLIKAVDEQNTHVIHWHFSELLPKAWLYIPETLIIEHQCDENQVLEINETENSSYYFCNDKSNAFLAQKSLLMNTPERFAISTGVQPSQSKLLTFEKKLNLIISGLSKLKPKQWLAFLPKNEQINWWPIVIKSVLPATTLVLIYIVLSSAYLFTINAHYNNTLNEQSENVNDLLNLQQSVDEKQTTYIQLQQFLADKNSYLPLWLELSPLFEHVNISNIRVDNGRVQIRGSAKQATSIMEILTKSPNVITAKFDSPVSQSRRSEQFIISFTLTNQLMLDNKFSTKAVTEGADNE